jgi:hypothetical protein
MIKDFNKWPVAGEPLSAGDISMAYRELINLGNITAETPLFVHVSDGGYHFRLDLDALGTALNQFTYNSSTISANTNNLSLTNTFNFVDATTNISITGILAPENAVAQSVYIKNVGTGTITFPDESASSDAANRFQNPSNNSYSIGPNQTAGFVYDPVNARWEPMWSPNYTGVVYYNGATVTVTNTSTWTFNDNSTLNLSGDVNYNATYVGVFVSGSSTTYESGAVVVYECDVTFEATVNVKYIQSEYTYSTISTDQDNYAITNLFSIINASGAFSITGFVAPSDSTKSAFFFLKNSGTENITIPHQSGSSSSANQVYTQDGQDYVIQPHDVAGFIYDQQNNRWEPMWPTASQAGGGSVGTQYPGWVKITKTYTDLSAAATSNDIELYSLPAKASILAGIIKHTVQFSGGSISGYNVSVGVSGSSVDILNTTIVSAAVADTTFTKSSFFGPKMYDFGAAKSIRLFATSTDDDLDAATAGSVDVYLLVSTLP